MRMSGMRNKYGPPIPIDEVGKPWKKRWVTNLKDSSLIK